MMMGKNGDPETFNMHLYTTFKKEPFQLKSEEKNKSGKQQQGWPDAADSAASSCRLLQVH